MRHSETFEEMHYLPLEALREFAIFRMPRGWRMPDLLVWGVGRGWFQLSSFVHFFRPHHLCTVGFYFCCGHMASLSFAKYVTKVFTDFMSAHPGPMAGLDSGVSSSNATQIFS